MAQRIQSSLVALVNGNPNRKTKKELKQNIKNERLLAVDDDKLSKVPTWLDAYGKKVFKETVDTFKSTTLYNNADVTTIARYADMMSELKKCNDELKKSGRSNEKGDPSGFLSLKIKLNTELDKLADKLGLMPTSRTSLALHLKDDLQSKAKREALAEGDDFDEFGQEA